jgi:DNA-binding NtrC family response regulator
MPDMDGIQVLNEVLEQAPGTKVIIMSAFACLHLARQAMNRGAFDFVAKPFEAEEIRGVVMKAAEALGYGGGVTSDSSADVGSPPGGARG